MFIWFLSKVDYVAVEGFLDQNKEDTALPVYPKGLVNSKLSAVATLFKLVLARVVYP